MLSAKTKSRSQGLLFALAKQKEGFEQGGSRRSLRKKTVRWTVFADVVKERSDAKAHGSAPKKSLALRQNEKQVARPAFCFGKTKRGIRTRREQTQSAEENSPVDCFCRRGQGAKRREGARECAEKIPCSPPKVHRNSIKITVDFFYARKPLEIRLSAVQTYNKPRRRAFLWRGFVRFTVVSAI